MTISAALKQSYASLGAGVILYCVEITHETLTEPLRIVNQYEDVLVMLENGLEKTFFARAFKIKLPNNDTNSLKVIQLSIDNADKALTDILEKAASTKTPLELRLRIYLSNDLESVLNQPVSVYVVDEVSTKIDTVKLEARNSVISNKRFPSQIYGPKFRNLYINQ